MPSVRDPIAGHLAASMHVPTPVAQSEGNGTAIVDLDEAIFGLNALARELFGIAQSGIGQAAVHWQQEAATMGLDPMSWISASAYESDWSAIVSTIAVSAVSLPFAAMAIKGGIDEIRHGRAERRRLKLEQELLMARHARVATSPDGADTVAAPALERQKEKKTYGTKGLERALEHKDAARLERIGAQLSAADATVSIGAAATSSGSFMSVNALSEMLLQPILKCCSQGAAVVAWIAQHAVWSAIVSVVGTIGTFVLAPLAALSATWLGSSFVHRSRIKCRDFLHAKRLLTANIDGAPALANTPYARFLTAKLGKRAAFMLRFRNWSIGFLSGASTYTGGVLAKTALVGAALLGFGFVATNPVLLVALGAAITIGAVVMAIGSMNFIANLGRVKRHESYESLTHPLLDRSLFDAMDPVSQAVAGGTQPLSLRRGFRRRAGLYRRMVMQETVIQNLVGKAAKACGKRYVWTDRSDRTRYAEHVSTATPADRGKDAIAAIGAACVLAWQLLSGKRPARAWRAARQHYARQCSSITVHTLASALATDTDLHQRLCAIVRIQAAALRERTWDRIRLGVGVNEPPADATGAWLREQSSRLDSDLGLLGELMDYNDAHKARLAAQTDATEPVRVDKWFIARFLALEQKMGLCRGCTKASEKPDAATQYEELADYLLTQAPKNFATLRGGLLACEMDAARAGAMPAN